MKRYRKIPKAHNGTMPMCATKSGNLSKYNGMKEGETGFGFTFQDQQKPTEDRTAVFPLASIHEILHFLWHR